MNFSTCLENSYLSKLYICVQFSCRMWTTFKLQLKGFIIILAAVHCLCHYWISNMNMSCVRPNPIMFHCSFYHAIWLINPPNEVMFANCYTPFTFIIISWKKKILENWSEVQNKQQSTWILKKWPWRSYVRCRSHYVLLYVVTLKTEKNRYSNNTFKTSWQVSLSG